MSKKNATVAVFEGHTEAEDAVRELGVRICFGFFSSER